MTSVACAVGDQQHRFQPAQHAVGAPVLRQFDRGARQVALVLFQLRFEALEQRERVGGAAGEAGQHLAADRCVRTFVAPPFMTMLPSVTWPSPPSATLPPRRTETIVVP